MLCSKGAQLLQSKSLNVEEATNELIRMLLEVDESEEEKIPPADDVEDEEKKEQEDLEGTLKHQYCYTDGYRFWLTVIAVYIS